MMNILPEHKLLIPDVRQNGPGPVHDLMSLVALSSHLVALLRRRAVGRVVMLSMLAPT
jgi:hypothetical protein